MCICVTNNNTTEIIFETPIIPSKINKKPNKNLPLIVSIFSAFRCSHFQKMPTSFTFTWLEFVRTLEKFSDLCVMPPITRFLPVSVPTVLIPPSWPLVTWQNPKWTSVALPWTWIKKTYYSVPCSFQIQASSCLPAS